MLPPPWSPGTNKTGPPLKRRPKKIRNNLKSSAIASNWPSFAATGKLPAHSLNAPSNQNIELSLGSGPVLDASVLAMQALESDQANLSQTADDLSKAARDAQASVGIYDLLTSVLLAANRPVEAAHSAEYACRLQPHRADRLRMLLQCRLRAGGFANDAIRELRQHAAKLPFNDNLRELWISSEESLGDVETARSSTRPTAGNRPATSSMPSVWRGILVRTGRGIRGPCPAPQDDGAPVLDNPQIAPQAAVDLANALGRAGFAADARTLLRQMLQTIPGFPPAQAALMQAQLEEHLGDPAERRQGLADGAQFGTARLPPIVACLRRMAAGRQPPARSHHVPARSSHQNIRPIAAAHGHSPPTGQCLGGRQPI